MPAVGKTTALVPNIQFIAETFNISNFVNASIDNAIENTNGKDNVFPDYISFTYDEAVSIEEYIDNIKYALLNNK